MTKPVKFQFDKTADTDAFGPHLRIAQAIANVIATQSGGRCIAIEGTWGSGKSTIVKLLRDKLLELDSTRYSIFTFDAWAHEGDPLRRSFLESLYLHFSSNGWLSHGEWVRRLEELSGRLKRTTTKSTPLLTILGKLLLFSIFLVPLGVALVNSSLPKVSFQFDSAASPALRFIIGGLLTISPGLVLLFSMLVRKCRKERDFEWDLLLRKTTTEETTETIVTPEPTSIEFERWFSDLLSDALSKEGRRAVIVLDNLDRMGAEQALQLLSTIQNFLHGGLCCEPWFERIWLVVPFDSHACKQLFNDSARTSLDKLFQVTFVVPLPW